MKWHKRSEKRSLLYIIDKLIHEYTCSSNTIEDEYHFVSDCITDKDNNV